MIQNQDKDTFDVYFTAFDMGILTKENQKPLNPVEAVNLAINLTERIGITEVRIVWIRDDTIVFQWKNGKLIYI